MIKIRTLHGKEYRLPSSEEISKAVEHIRNKLKGNPPQQVGLFTEPVDADSLEVLGEIVVVRKNPIGVVGTFHIDMVEGVEEV